MRRILEAAERLLADQPPQEITSQEIAKAAGLTIGAFYRFYANRDAVLDEINFRRIGEAEELLTAFLERVKPQSISDLTAGFTDAVVVYLDANPAFRALWFAGYQSARAVAEDRRVLTAITQTFFEYLIGPLGMAETPDLCLRVTIGVEIGNALLELAFRQPSFPRDAIVDQAKLAIRRYFSDLS